MLVITIKQKNQNLIFDVTCDHTKFISYNSNKLYYTTLHSILSCTQKVLPGELLPVCHLLSLEKNLLHYIFCPVLIEDIVTYTVLVEVFSMNIFLQYKGSCA